MGAKRERAHERKQIAETIEDMGEGLTIVLDAWIASRSATRT